VDPTSLLGIRYFNKREAYIITQRILREDPSTQHAKPYITLTEFKHTVSQPRSFSRETTLIKNSLQTGS